MGTISVEQADRLYWLGRYTERVYTTVKMFFKSFDTMIDEIDDFTESYEEFCKMIDIPNIYKDKMDFLKRYPFDEENPDSIFANLLRAYDNAIVLREQLGSETLSYIQLAIYEMNKAKISRAPLVEMQGIIDYILAFWGIVDDQIDSEQVRNLIKAGKRIERIDLYARLGIEKPRMVREVNRAIPRIEKSGVEYDKQMLDELAALVRTDNVDFYEIVYKVENIIKV